MCLCIPSKVIEIYSDKTALVDTMGVKKRVSIHLLGESVAPADYLLIHVGFAISKIDEDEALASLATYRELMDEVGPDQMQALLG